jgi:methionyl-tRNA formyltransferase
MKITLLCDNKKSWIIPFMDEIAEKLRQLGHKVSKIYDYKNITKSDLLFILSCENIIPEKYLKLNKYNLVIHESNLPEGKGWSPLTWQVLEGRDEIPITLFEAAEEVDSGKIYLQDTIDLDGTELNSELKNKQGEKTKELILEFVIKYPDIEGSQQKGKESFYPKRNPEDSELDPDKTLKEQFNLLRVVDNERYPAFFKLNGQKYILKIYKDD